MPFSNNNDNDDDGGDINNKLFDNMQYKEYLID